ncbi:aminoacyl-histidine dipeptidase [Aureibacter tunicatorum]|uniref:Cytosol non-specific dipeptidase n=1 Tax=Aureibacter tunicatorum TaxID=866807 RepID=A0AAE4BST9_9BACT|nr:aminoacyl-histidine dipeptidase [Aureibacter tunicatorum]MDR6239230.1 dipeptidase D [Aureibacter tunicatorum]BDD04845.1 aminoacyl-histidine dipeptidase [Aureibacter tunicatorum]
MNKEVANLEPKAVWTAFEQLNEVPRPSKHEERVIEFAKSFGENLGLKTKVDGAGNVIIQKPATPGYEDRKTVILQGHLDMVHQKNADTDFDFSLEGIKSYIDGDWVKAKGTTLGADNGMGVAAAMAVLSSNDVEHGPLEVLFTIDEETGMTGAFALQAGELDGDILLNLDTEEEGELTVGCAGGLDANVNGTYAVDEVGIVDFVLMDLAVKGLKGGHSGMEIHLGRANANKLMNRILYKSLEAYGVRIIEIDGGSLRNAIPRESFVKLAVPKESLPQFEEHIRACEEEILDEYSVADSDIRIEWSNGNLENGQVISSKDQVRIVNAIYALPNGVIRMSNDIEGLVETSTNLARVLVKDGGIKVQCLIRSSVESAKMDVGNMVRANFEQIGAEVELAGDYPGWKPNPSSEILSIMKNRYRQMFAKEVEVNACHAGLECGILGTNYPGLDMISFGPTIKNPHSPDEMCHIESVKLFWDYLLDVLRNIPSKA